MVFDSASAIDFSLRDCHSLPRPGRILLASPTHFEVAYVINPHMAEHVGTVDGVNAARQWRSLRDAYETLGLTINVIEGREGLPDMVFSANQTLPYHHPVTGNVGVVLSRMFAPERRGEVEHFERFFLEIGYDVVRLPPEHIASFEGMGDAIWHPRRFLLWGGHGFRSSPEAYEEIARRLEVRVVRLRLKDPDFYHLDTCFCPLDEETVLIYPGAFESDALESIHRLFDRVLEAPEDDARRRLACNAHCPDAEHVLIHEGCAATIDRLREAGFVPVGLDVSEFLKAGGSVFCMKQAFW